RITRGTIRISQSKVPSPGADETIFPTGDVRYGEAFPTDSSLIQTKTGKTLLRPLLCPIKHYQGLLLLVVVSLVATKTSRIDGYLYQPAKATLTYRGKGEKACSGGCFKHGGVDQGEDFLVGDTVKDSDKSADKGSDSTDEMANVLGNLGATNILARGGL
nr:hypothetical protein [Tanacetum cinerariifolium]